MTAFLSDFDYVSKVALGLAIIGWIAYRISRTN